MDIPFISFLVVFAIRIVQDLIFSVKIEMFNRGNRVGVFLVNFFESIIGMTIIAAMVRLLDNRPTLLIALGLGSSLGGLCVIALRRRLDRRLIGQRQYFARISYTGNPDLLQVLIDEGYNFSVEEKEFTDGVTRTVIEGSMINRQRKEHLKNLLRGRENKIVTIIPAREVYWV